MIEIYIIRCRVNGKIYVGQTKCGIKRRWSQHVASSKYDWKRQYSAIARAIYKYGSESFTISTLMSGIKTPEEANEVEIRMIAQCRATDQAFGYNLHPGGSYLYKGKPRTHRGKWGDKVFAPIKRNEHLPVFPNYLKIKLPDGASPKQCWMRAGQIARQLDVDLASLKHWYEGGLITGIMSGETSLHLNIPSVQKFIDSRKVHPRSEAA